MDSFNSFGEQKKVILPHILKWMNYLSEGSSYNEESVKTWHLESEFSFLFHFIFTTKYNIYCFYSQPNITYIVFSNEMNPQRDTISCGIYASMYLLDMYELSNEIFTTENLESNLEEIPNKNRRSQNIHEDSFRKETSDLLEIFFEG